MSNIIGDIYVNDFLLKMTEMTSVVSGFTNCNCNLERKKEKKGIIKSVR